MADGGVPRPARAAPDRPEWTCCSDRVMHVAGSGDGGCLSELPKTERDWKAGQVGELGHRHDGAPRAEGLFFGRVRRGCLPEMPALASIHNSSRQ